MMENSICIKVFLASPSDVKKERDIVAYTISKINRNEGRRHTPPFYIDLYRWEKDLTPDWNEPQENINLQLKPHEVDIFIGILWSKFGTKTKLYESGTEEEFNSALESWIKTNKYPLLSFYRCMRKISVITDPRQIKKVNNFFDTNKKVFTYSPYKTIKKFEDELYFHLCKKCSSIADEYKSSSPGNRLTQDSQIASNVGITRIYTFINNEERNNAKSNYLNAEKGDIKLIAHSGNSYLNPGDNYPAPDDEQGRFFDDVRRRLLGCDSKIQVVLLNPYSLEARKIHYAEKFAQYRNGISEVRLNSLEQGKNHRRFEQCLDGVEKLKEELRKNNYPSDRLEVRISNTATDGTALIGKDRLFYEPYLSARFLDRLRRGLNIFEVEVQNLTGKECSNIIYGYDEVCKVCRDREECGKNLYKTIAEQFLLLWETSIPLNEYRTQVHKYKEDFEQYHAGLFENQLVQLHDSWFALDPIIGCRGMCSYCFLSPHGWENTKPRIRFPLAQDASNFTLGCYSQIQKYPFYKQSSIAEMNNSLTIAKVPIAIGNKADMLSDDNLPLLMQFITYYKDMGGDRPLVLITKQQIPINLIELLTRCSFPVYIFFSISFLDRTFEPNVPEWGKRVESAKLAKEYLHKGNFTNVHLIHYWRPVTDLVIHSEECLQKVKDIFECSVLIGLKVTPEILQRIKTYPDHPLHEYLKQKRVLEREKIPSEGLELFYPEKENIISNACAIHHPTYLHTSCAISYLQEKVDFNGSMFRNDICPPCSSCPEQQVERCQQFKKTWDLNNYISNIQLALRLDRGQIKDHNDCVEITGESVCQEDLTFLTHLIGKPVYSRAVRLSLVWPSGNQRYFWKKYE